MNKVALRILAAAVSLGLAVAAGCSQGAPQRDGPATYPVTGTVTQGGAPVVGATVRFELTDGSKASTGMTDDRGLYTLSTFASGDGALAGDYRVTIVKMAAAGGAPPVSEDDPNYTGNEKEGEMKNVLPPKYSDVETSKLTAQVTEGSNSFDFRLD